MHPIIADISDASSQGIKDILIVIGFGVAVAAAIFGMVRKHHAIPQPFTTQKAPDYASADGVRALATRVAEIDRDLQSFKHAMHEMEVRLIKAGDARAASIFDALHDRMSPVTACLHDLAGQVKELAAQVHETNTRLPRETRKS